MNELIKIENIDGSLLVDSRIIAEELGIQHKNLLESIGTHLEIIESEFGRVAFETLPLQTAGGVQKVKIAHLNEDQAIFIGTLSRNNEKVVLFKARLVKAFSIAKQALSSVAKSMTIEEMIIAQAQSVIEVKSKVAELEKRQNLLEAQTKTIPDYFTVVGYASLNKIQVGLQLAAKLGSMASRLCKSQNIMTGEIPDPRFGKVKTYPTSILEQVFQSAIN